MMPSHTLLHKAQLGSGKLCLRIPWATANTVIQSPLQETPKLQDFGEGCAEENTAPYCPVLSSFPKPSYGPLPEGPVSVSCQDKSLA